MKLKSNLNKEQKQAIKADGNVIIIAGPGTGKTRTLTHKIAYLLQEKKVDPNEIVALTFTKKAAAEMMERVDLLISKQIPNHKPPISKQKTRRLPSIGTFHSLAFELLKKHSFEPEIVSERQLAEIVRKICGKYKKVTKRLSEQDIKRYISLHKTGTEAEIPEFVPEIVEDYDKELRKKELMDYDDLLIKALELAKENEINYKHILVDEFQDTNELQYQLLKKMLNKKGNIFVIGDPFQSIYGFRGSNEKIFETFKKDFQDATETILESNYRSGKIIIQSSKGLFKGIYQIKNKRKTDGDVKIIKTFNEYSEADWILSQVNEKVGGIDLNFAGEVDMDKAKSTFADFAVVYRIHSLRRVLEKKFLEFGIPYQIVGGDSLYEQKQIKFIILSLNFLAADVSMFQNIDTSNIVDQKGELVEEINRLGVVDEKANLIKEKLDQIDVSQNVSQLVEKIIDSFSLEKQLKDESVRSQYLKEFMSTTVRFNNQKDGLQKLLSYIKYLEKHEYYDERADKVTLMTMHAAKGLEFPFVYIVGFENGIIPYKKSVDEGNIEEEKRLLYVAMTRAMDELQLLITQKRYGKRTTDSQFFEIIKRASVQVVKDPQIEKIKRRIERSKKKQLGLF